MKFGLLYPGNQTPDGLLIERPKHHFGPTIKAKGINNFSEAIFASKSPFYASCEAWCDSF